MDVLKELDPDQVDSEQALDIEEDGSETQESSSVEPPISTAHVGEQKGVNKRIHDVIVAHGHKTHPSQSQRMGNVAGSNPTGSINANLANISQSQASAPTPVTKPTFKNVPSASGILASAPCAHLGNQNIISRQSGRGDSICFTTLIVANFQLKMSSTEVRVTTTFMDRSIITIAMLVS